MVLLVSSITLLSTSLDLLRELRDSKRYKRRKILTSLSLPILIVLAPPPIRTLRRIIRLNRTLYIV